jgi:YfiH family protein
MFKIQQKDLPLWQFENLSVQKDIRHFVSCREGGFSKGAMGSLNLSFKVGDDATLVSKNRNKLAEAFDVSPDKLIFPVQTHSSHVKIVTKDTKPEELEDTDAIITAEKGILISVMSADCVPILLYDTKTKVVAAIHAGWRGTMAWIVKKTIQKMEAEYNSDTNNFIACIGPSISEEVYEVGEEVITAVEKVYGTKTGIISKEQNGKGFCNLWEANRIQLIKSGVKDENIEVAGLCTFKHSDIFYSYRKDGARAGRFAAGIMRL